MGQGRRAFKRERMTRKTRQGATGRVADVGLLLEGTYPYVAGGVSSWTHQLLRNLPELSFSLVYLGGRREDHGAPKFELPSNVLSLTHCYLMEEEPAAGRRVELQPEAAPALGACEALHESFRDPSLPPSPAALRFVQDWVGAPGVLDAQVFERSDESWDFIERSYESVSSELPYTEYFWTVRTLHRPLFRIAELLETIPPCRSFHAISTGYAGFLGALLRRRRGVPFMLTEHGIYTKERKIELSHATWLDDHQGLFSVASHQLLGHFRQMWIRLFEALSRMTYSGADPITSLYEGNRARQIQDGAEAQRTCVIPNGVSVERFAKLRSQRPARPPPVLGLLGRVVPIKDARTFIRALALVRRALPDAEGWLIGPTDEDPRYAEECEALAVNLGVGDAVKFLGFRKPEEVLPRMGLLVLTSISEALPLVVLEAFAAGLPALTTDVGSCRELIEGNQPEDRALGSAGAVVPIADPEATAREAVSLLTDHARWTSAQRAGIARVERYYRDGMMFDRYRALYLAALEGSDGGDRLRAS